MKKDKYLTAESKVMAIFTPNERKMLNLLAGNPKAGPTEIARELGWSRREGVPEAIRRLKKKIQELGEANELLKELGIKSEDVEKW